MQVGFLIQKEKVTAWHNISPIEVKSGTNYTLASLKKCIKKFSPNLLMPSLRSSTRVVSMIAAMSNAKKHTEQAIRASFPIFFIGVSPLSS